MTKYQVAYGSTATRLFTDADRLREKTAGYLEIEFSAGQWQASLYRASSSAPGQLSRDWYQWNGSVWERGGEDSRKYANPPARTDGHRTQIGTFEVWSEQPLTEDVKQQLRELLKLFPTVNE